jgi:hypothetical protein
LWRDLKQRISELVEGKQTLPVCIIDEAQNLPPEFFHDFPSFLNFAFDSRDLLIVWLSAHPSLASTLERTPCAALYGRIQARVQLKPVIEQKRFTQLIAHALKSAGCTRTLLSDSGLKLLRQASRGLPRAGWQHPHDVHATGCAQGAEPYPGRSAATSHWGIPMNRKPRRPARRSRQPDRTTRSPALPDLSDEAAAQVQHLLSELFLWFRAAYREPIRHYY